MKKDNNHIYTSEEIAKIGNTIIYFSEKIKRLNKTKLLKLLYLLEENSVKKYHLPFLDLEFEAWQLGPVAKDIFIDLSGNTSLLKNYIKTNTTINNAGNDEVFINAIKPFCDDEFSDNEIELLEFIVAEFGNKTAAQLVEYTHRANSLWYTTAKKNDLLEAFEKKLTNSSSVQLDLSSFLNDCEKKRYNAKQEFNSMLREMHN